MRIRLEDKLVQALGPGEYSDTVRPGLVLRVRTTGDQTSRVFGVRYRPKGAGNPRRYRIGDAKTISLADARAEARQLMAGVVRGEDPQAAKVEARRVEETGTLGALAVRFTADQSREWRPRTRQEFERLLRREILPKFGTRRPEDILRGDVKLWAAEVAETRPTTANRAFEVLRLVYAWAVEADVLQGTPFASLKKPHRNEASRDRTYCDAELRRILQAASATAYAGVIPFVLWTGVRSHEARSARWQDMDLRRHIWTIPAKYIKRSRRSRSEPRRVPLNAPAIELLRARGPRDLGWVFQARTGPCENCGERGHVGKNTHVVTTVRRVSGVEDFRMHDVRRTVGQRVADEFGTGRMHLVLGHARGELADTYAPAPSLKLAREALDWWGGELARIEKRA